MCSLRVLRYVLLGGLCLGCPLMAAQSPGAERWQVPFGRVVTFGIGQNGSGGALKGSDDQPAGDAGSDANLKENFRNRDDNEVLARLAEMPIQEWNYRAQDPAIRHMGPTARDFHAAFGLGEDPLRIGMADAAGVALRAIQALERRGRAQHEHLLEDTQSLADEIGSLVRENAERTADIAALKAEIAALRAELAALRQARR